MSDEGFEIVGVLLDDLSLLPAGVQDVIAQRQGTEMADELKYFFDVGWADILSLK